MTLAGLRQNYDSYYKSPGEQGEVSASSKLSEGKSTSNSDSNNIQ